MKLTWSWRLATGETLEEMLELLYLQGKSDEQMASLLSAMSGLHVSVPAARRKRQTMGLGKDRKGVPLVAPSSMSRFDKPPIVEGDVLALFDLHIPFHDAVFVNRCLMLADLWDLPTLILPGDVVDLVALSSFAPEFGEDKPDLKSEFAEAGKFFDACQGFDKVLWLGGNHELRFLRRLGSSTDMSSLASQVTQLPCLEASNYHYCFHKDGWLFGHPKNASVIPGRVPQFLSRKFSRYNIVTGHGHLWGMVQAEDGERLAVDAGVSCDPERLAYDMVRLSTRPATSQGGFILKRGKPWLLHPRWTDWKALRSITW